MNMQGSMYTREKLLDEKRDYSPFLVHLTKDSYDYAADGEKFIIPAKDVLDCILNDQELKAFSYFCLFNGNLDSQNSNIKDLFKVTCFTETPLDQIDILTTEVYGRVCKLKPYGLVFTKKFIRENQGNPVFYVDEYMFDSLFTLYDDAKNRNFSFKDYKTLALVNKCTKDMDFHWEREWRIVGNLKFKLTDIFCGLCPDDDISYFQNHYPKVRFISPHWNINTILHRLVGK